MIDISLPLPFDQRKRGTPHLQRVTGSHPKASTDLTRRPCVFTSKRIATCSTLLIRLFPFGHQRLQRVTLSPDFLQKNFCESAPRWRRSGPRPAFPLSSKLWAESILSEGSVMVYVDTEQRQTRCILHFYTTLFQTPT